MSAYKQKLDNLKFELLSLYVEFDVEKHESAKIYERFQQIMGRLFDVQNSSLFLYKQDKLYTIESKLGYAALREGVNWDLVSTVFANKLYGKIPPYLHEVEVLREFDEMVLLKEPSKEPFGVLFYQNSKIWSDIQESDLFEETCSLLTKTLTKLHKISSLSSNEKYYRKLYNLTGLFHSTMDTDEILKNISSGILDNFDEVEVELILSNDQDRQTNLKFRQFDYLEERSSTIEAFVSGDLTIEFATDLQRKLLNIPIKGRQATYGIIQVSSNIHRIYAESDKNYLRTLAQAAGNALENAKLYHQSHRLVADLQMINETSHRLNLNLSIDEMLLYLQKQLIKSFNPSDLCFVFKEEEYKLTNVASPLFYTDLGKDYLQYVQKHFENSQDSLFIADYARVNDASYYTKKSLMAIPMAVGNHLNGYCLVLHENPYYFSFDSFKLMQSLIHHSTLAISNSILRDRLQQLVDLDHLTKLYARRYLDRYVESSLETDESGMFLLIDIDNFKHVNDTFGHQVGDEVLVQIAEQLKTMIATRGICARWGGEEIAIYVPNILQNEAVKISSTIVEMIPTVTNPTVTISAGLVTWSKNERPAFEEIFLQADTALYNAKNNGKNQFFIYEKAMQLHQ